MDARGRAVAARGRTPPRLRLPRARRRGRGPATSATTSWAARGAGAEDHRRRHRDPPALPAGLRGRGAGGGPGALRRALLTFVVVGGGPTGVEMAGAFAEIARHTLAQRLPPRGPQEARVVLVEGGPRLLAAYPEALSEQARRELEELGVEVRLGAPGDGHHRRGGGAGGGADRGAQRGVGRRRGRLAPGRAPGRPHRPDGAGGGGAGPLRAGAPGAVRGGRPGGTSTTSPAGRSRGWRRWRCRAARAAARNIGHDLAGEPRRPFRYLDKGSMATIGRAARRGHGGGRCASRGCWRGWRGSSSTSCTWSASATGVVVLVQWAWSYLTWQRGARLITGEVGPRLGPARGQARRRAEAGGGGWMEGDPAQARAAE